MTLKTQYASYAEKLASESRTLGSWSAGLLMIILLLRLIINSMDVRKALAVGCLYALLFLVNLGLGLLACIIALIALWINWKKSNDATIKRTATIGMVLGVISTIILLLLEFLSG